MPKNSQAPFALGLTFSLLLSLFSFAYVPLPATAENLTTCIGGGTFSGLISLGGRLLTPATIVRADTACQPSEIAKNMLVVTRTLLVSPVGSESQNGAALQLAMQIIATAGPSATNPWLLKIEPGRYLLNSPLIIAPFVDVEGSGENSTILVGGFATSSGSTVPTPTNGTLVAAANSEVRFLTVNSYRTAFNSGTATAIFIPSGTLNSRLYKVSAYTTSTTFNWSVYNQGKVTLVNSLAVVTGNAAGGGAGLVNTGSNAELLFQDSQVDVNVSNGLLNNTDHSGIANDRGIVTITNSTIWVRGGDDAIGIGNSAGRLTVINSSVTGSDTQDDSYGLINAGQANVLNSSIYAKGSPNFNEALQSTVTATNLFVANSLVQATGGKYAYGLHNSGPTARAQATTLSGTGGSLENHGIFNSAGQASVTGSLLTGTGNGASGYNKAARNDSGTLNIGGSQLESVEADTGSAVRGTVKCVNSYNNNFVSLNANCTI